MKNKEMKKPIPVELDDNALDNVSGGLIILLPSLDDIQTEDDIFPVGAIVED